MTPDELLSDRVERLEKTVDGRQTLPAAVAALGENVAVLGERVGSVETQILQLRTEMRSEFSDVRSEMRTAFAAVRSEMQTGLASVKTELRQEMHEGFASARDDMLVGLANLTNELGTQIRETAEEGKRHSQTLFEEALGRIATLGEHRVAPPGRKAPAPRRKR